VLEVVGHTGSGKTELLVQAAVTCILPEEADGVRYGGSAGAFPACAGCGRACPQS
jgi:RecA/RadA recombinase